MVGSAVVSLLLAAPAVGVARSDACVGSLEFGSEDGAVHTWTADDARLSGTAVPAGGWTPYAPPSEDAGVPDVEPASYVIINDDGTWQCATSSPAGPEPDLEGHALVFSGTGAYEGLTAHVRIDWDAYPFIFRGVIVADDVPEDPTLAG